MKRTGLLVLTFTLAALVGLALVAEGTGYDGTPPPGDRYVVGGEIVPVNPVSYIFSPLFVGLVVVVAFIVAALTVKGFPVRITVERQ
jgi:hypothetical protein